jgi:16S rRNA (cytosine967-C5)-methyltransferase
VSGCATPRLLAAEALARVLDAGQTLEQVFPTVLAGADRETAAACRSLAFGATRGFFRHEAILRRLLDRRGGLTTLVRALLSVALFELEDGKTPEYAVVDAAVGAAKTAAKSKMGPLVNAVLRRYLRERAQIDAQIAADPIARYAAAPWMAELLRRDWPEQWRDVLAASDCRAPLWLRMHPLQTSAVEYQRTLQAIDRVACIEPRVPLAIRLQTAGDVTELPGFRNGAFSVQDLGAQCALSPLDLAPGQRVLDACAAPGGKTCLIAAAEPRLASLVAVDVDASRLERVRENLLRCGFKAELHAGDAAYPSSWWDGQVFDRILLDAPCSALGVIRRHPDIRLLRRKSDIAAMAQTQSRLLDGSWPTLARGGRLVYATCTWTHEENHDVIAAFLARTKDADLIEPRQWQAWPGFGTAGGIGRQILPGEAGADGFYYACLTKT